MSTVDKSGRLNPQEGPRERMGATETGRMGNNRLSLADGQTSKGWFILAMAIGALVVIGAGGFGSVGLLQSHGLISLPQWLTSAIGTVGNTPHFWSLWALGAGGIVLGGGLFATGAYKIHQIRQNDKERASLEKAQERRAQLLERFGDNFAKLDVDTQVFNNLLNGTYITQHFGRSVGEGATKTFIPEDRPDKNFIVIRSHEGELLCTTRITEEEKDRLVSLLKLDHNYSLHQTP